MSNHISRQEAVPGLIVRSATRGEVMILNAPSRVAGRTVVNVEAWGWDGQPFSTYVPLTDLRWQ